MKKGFDYIGTGVVFLCTDGEGNYLFLKRSQNCRDEKGMWDCGGGGIDFGDTAEETLIREIKEEYCCDIISYEFLGYRDVHRVIDNKKSHWVALDFKVIVDKNQAKNGEPHKFEKIDWFTLDNLPSPIHSQLKYTIDKYRDKL